MAQQSCCYTLCHLQQWLKWQRSYSSQEAEDFLVPTCLVHICTVIKLYRASHGIANEEAALMQNRICAILGPAGFSRHSSCHTDTCTVALAWCDTVSKQGVLHNPTPMPGTNCRTAAQALTHDACTRTIQSSPQTEIHSLNSHTQKASTPQILQAVMRIRMKLLCLFTVRQSVTKPPHYMRCLARCNPNALA